MTTEPAALREAPKPVALPSLTWACSSHPWSAEALRDPFILIAGSLVSLVAIGLLTDMGPDDSPWSLLLLLALLLGRILLTTSFVYQKVGNRSPTPQRKFKRTTSVDPSRMAALSDFLHAFDVVENGLVAALGDERFWMPVQDRLALANELGIWSKSEIAIWIAAAQARQRILVDGDRRTSERELRELTLGLRATQNRFSQSQHNDELANVTA